MRIEPPIAREDLPACVLEAGEGEPIGPMTVNQYFRMPVTNQRESLVYGWLVREACPTDAHEFALMELVVLLHAYVKDRRLGRVCLPLDVVLDEPKRLTVQPDAMVIFHDRLRFRKGRLRTAPNIAIEVKSPSTAKRDRTVKLDWYRTYGVQEYWIVDVHQKQIDVIDLTAQPQPIVATYRRADALRSRVLPDFTFPVTKVFTPIYGYAYPPDDSPEEEKPTRYARKMPRRKR
jgi:Uma2 family endonuclease